MTLSQYSFAQGAFSSCLLCRQGRNYHRFRGLGFRENLLCSWQALVLSCQVWGEGFCIGQLNEPFDEASWLHVALVQLAQVKVLQFERYGKVLAKLQQVLPGMPM